MVPIAASLVLAQTTSAPLSIIAMVASEPLLMSVQLSI